eukprot:s6251_g1.t1
MLNVMRGGTLIGDIESQTDSKIKHLRDSSEPDYDSYRHPITVKPQTPLAEWFADSLGQHEDPNSLMESRQRFRARVGEGELGWSLAPMAHSPDGIIEGFYDPRYNPKMGQFVVGLQFHPERMLSDYPGCARCYESFLEAYSLPNLLVPSPQHFALEPASSRPRAGAAAAMDLAIAAADFNEKARKVWQALSPKIAASFANAKEAVMPHVESAQTVAEEAGS